MSKRAINSPATTLNAEQWSDYVANRVRRRAHPKPVMLTGEQVAQITTSCHQAREILFCVNLLTEFPEEWNEQLRAIRSTASTIRYAAKAPGPRYLPPADDGIAAELLGRKEQPCENVR
jgi:hypothetical protein